MTSKNSKDNNDLQLFQQAVQDIEPIKHDRVMHKMPAKPTSKKKPVSADNTIREEQRFSTEHVPECDVILGFERPGLQKSVMKKLRQGKMPVEASLDLHGYTAEQARSAMIEFMDFCHLQQFKVVCIVHGKGFGSSERKPVIKPLINKWLQELNQVLAFSSAQPKDGGTGAVYVLLRKEK